MSPTSVASVAAEQRTRTYPIRAIGVRDNTDGGYRVEGYAAVFSAPSEDLGGFRERIKRGAFRSALSRDDLSVKLLFDHSGMPLASTSGGTLRLAEDVRGLQVSADIADTTLGRDLRVALKRGDLDKMSFAFQIGREDWTTEEGQSWAIVTDVSRLFDVSIVSQPAYSSTEVHARHAAVKAREKEFTLRKAALLATADATLAKAARGTNVEFA